MPDAGSLHQRVRRSSCRADESISVGTLYLSGAGLATACTVAIDSFRGSALYAVVCRKGIRMTRLPSRVIGGALKTMRIRSGRRKLLRDLVVRVGEHGGSRKVTVPKDFVTDFSSIPWFGRWVVRWSRVDIAGVVHDYLYTLAGSDKYGCSRACIDIVWYRIAVSGETRANRMQAMVCWFAIRVGGSTSFRKKPGTFPPPWPSTKSRPLAGCLLIVLLGLVTVLVALVVTGRSITIPWW